MKTFCAVLFAVSLPLITAAEPPKATKIEDGKTTTLSIGLKFDVPANWNAKLAKEGVYALVPDGSNPTGVVEELYLFAYDRMPGADPGSDAVRKELDKVVAELLPNAELKGDPKDGTFGAFEGKIWTFDGKAQDGKTARLRCSVFVRGDYICALLELGYPKALKARKDDVQAILGSIRKSKKPKAGASAVRPELCGSWAYITNFSANNGGGRTTSTVLTLNADGTYKYAYDHESSNPFGAAWGTERDSGTWTATETSITFKSSGGETETYTLEKRNHPKNVGDPMIVVGGKAFVTMTPKDPWR